MTQLSFRLLGSAEIRKEGQPVRGFVSVKAQALLIYLAVTARKWPRATLATLLWGEFGETAARRNLSKTLSNLRRLVGDYLEIDRHNVAFTAENPCWLDTHAFTQGAQQITQAPPTQRQLINCQEIIALYRGEFLIGFHTSDAPEFESWLRSRRAHFYRLYCDLLTHLTQQASMAEDFQQALAWATRLLEIDPANEWAHCQLMALYVYTGQRNHALAQYRRCCEALTAELDVAPAAETTQLYRAISEGQPPIAETQWSLHRAHTIPDAAPQPKRTTAQQATHSVPPLQKLVAAQRTTFIGRAMPMQRLREAWQQNVGTGSHFCLIHGEAGVGKSRLAEEFLAWATAQGAAVSRTRAYAAAGELAYTPIVNWLRSPALQHSLSTIGEPWLSEIAQILPELADHNSLPQVKTRSSLLGGDSRWKRQRLFDALTVVFRSGKAPNILFIDDLHWCDGETLDWLHYFMQVSSMQISSMRVSSPSDEPLRTTPQTLIICTARPEIHHQGHIIQPMLTHLRSIGILSEIALPPFDVDTTALLAGQITGKECSATELTELYQYTEGNPLFVIESVRSNVWQRVSNTLHGEMQIKQDDHSAPEQPTMSAKMQAVLQERLAQLSPAAHTLAGLAATIGRSFNFILLRLASTEQEEHVVRALDELWQRGIVAVSEGQQYDFSHDRIREVAYLMGGPVQRPLWHRQVARALEAFYAEELAPVSAQLAFHWEAAGEIEQAIGYYQQAATKAHEIFADGDALALLQQALDMIKTLPDTAHVRKLELAILLQMKHPLIISQGFVPKLGEICTRARLLCEQVGTVYDLYDALSGLRTVYQMRAEYKAAHTACEMMIALSKKMKNGPISGVAKAQGLLSDPVTESPSDIGPWEATGYRLLGTTLLYQGELEIAQEKFAKAFAAGVQEVGLFIFSSMNLWLLGYPQQARQNMLQAWLIAERSQNPYSMGFAMANLARLNHILRRETPTQLWATKTIELSNAYDIPFWPRLGGVLLGRVLAVQGKTEQGISLLQTTLHAMDIDQHFAFRTYFIALLAEAYACSGQYHKALTQLSTALEFCERNGERFWHAELIRLRGEYQHALGMPPNQVISCYEEAIAIAQTLQAKSLELRATISLARLWQQQGQHETALARLSAIYGWFTEGFNTADLRDAKALLAELSTMSLQDN